MKDALGVAVPRHVDKARPVRASAGSPSDTGSPRRRDRPARGQQAGEGPQELALTVSLDAGEADDLSGA